VVISVPPLPSTVRSSPVLPADLSASSPPCLLLRSRWPAGFIMMQRDNCGHITDVLFRFVGGSMSLPPLSPGGLCGPVNSAFTSGCFKIYNETSSPGWRVCMGHVDVGLCVVHVQRNTAASSLHPRGRGHQSCHSCPHPHQPTHLTLGELFP
jgi:hypothetical protein